ARRAVEDDIEDRRFAFGGAVRHLLRSAARRGRIDDEIAWIDSRHPGIFDVDAARVPQKYRNVQGLALETWALSLPPDELNRRLDVLMRYAEALGVDPTENPRMHVAILMVRGDVRSAIDVALEKIFTESVALHLDWLESFAEPQYADFVADERVQRALDRWEEEKAALRGSLQAYFADMRASRPDPGRTISRTAASSAPSSRFRP
ncbi:MAG: hypothetical protein MJA32_11510, partial [Proteobacteria bacterium]|nr:hypothetical protein [Pseudomonadota bacterium]